MVDLLTIAFGLLILVGVVVAGYLTVDRRYDQPTDAITETREAITERNWLVGTKTALASMGVLPLLAIGPVIGILPGSWKVYHRLMTWCTWQMQKSAGADVVANVRRANGKEDFLPAAYVESDDDENERSGWKIKGFGNKRYKTGVYGGSSTRFGKSDLIHLDGDGTNQGSWEEASMDNAFQTDRERYVVRDAKVRAKHVTVDASGNQLVGDGGEPVESQEFVQNVTLDQPGVLQDVLVPLDSPEGYDGQQVSLSQFRTAQTQTSDQETVREAKNSGWLAAKLDSEGDTNVLFWLIVVGLWSAVLLWHEEIGSMIGGGGGDAASQAASSAGLGMIKTVPMLANLGVF